MQNLTNENKTYRYRCAVRQILLWRVQWGKVQMEKYIAEHHFDKQFLSDVNNQWMKGNRGMKGDWR